MAFTRQKPQDGSKAKKNLERIALCGEAGSLLWEDCWWLGMEMRQARGVAMEAQVARISLQ